MNHNFSSSLVLSSIHVVCILSYRKIRTNQTSLAEQRAGQWEDGRMELTNDEFDLLAVIKFLSWGLRDLLDQKQIQFNMHIDALAKKCLAQHRVVADKHRVVQTLGDHQPCLYFSKCPSGCWK